MQMSSDTTRNSGDDEAVARVSALEPNHCVATWRRFVVIIWRHDTTHDGVSDLRRALTATASKSEQIALVTIVEPNAPPPPSEVRDALARLLGEFGRTIRFSAVAFEGSGFRAAMVRGVVTGLTLLARMPYPHKVFAGVDESSRWLTANLHGIGWRETQAELIEAVAELRRRITAA
jgi:hypothetical protein